VKDVQEILKLMSSPSEQEEALIIKAFNFAQKAHGNQKRFSGEPYFYHLVESAKILAEQGLDAPTIAAGLLHDTMEDLGVTAKEIEKEFNKEVAFLVKGVTKLGKLKYRGMERHAESLRKLFVATSQDIRVLIIKLADRAHNVSTLEHVRPEKQKRIAIETLEIYAPLANRLGMGNLKAKLEDYSFPYAYPEEYQKVKKLLKKKRRENIKSLEKVYRTIQIELVKQDIKNVKVDYRLKNIYSLYKKLLKRDMDINSIYDIVALRVIAPSVPDCYRLLGFIHGLWKPVPGRIKDYIAIPKINGYQSLHTTIFTGDGGMAEIQIRTPKMHKEAEYGIASHVNYKEGIFKGKKGDAVSKKMEWMKKLVKQQKTIKESGQFLDNLKSNFFYDRVFVFTPMGDVVDLPKGSTTLDFAYAIHSLIGRHASGAKINNKMVSLDTELKNEDIVEIQTRKNNNPTSKWLNYTKTTNAQKAIRRYLQQHSWINKIRGKNS